MTSIITQIWNAEVKDFDEAEAWIDQQIAKVEAVFPSATATINAVSSDLKQAASDAIGDADTALNTIAPAFTTAVEAGADAALTKYTGGLALPLVGLTNDAIQKVVALGTSTLNSWALKVQAALAENQPSTAATPAALKPTAPLT
jgi:hypothetical protein